MEFNESCVPLTTLAHANSIDLAPRLQLKWKVFSADIAHNPNIPSILTCLLLTGVLLALASIGLILRIAVGSVLGSITIYRVGRATYERWTGTREC